MSISVCTLLSGFSSTIMAKIEVPADTLPVRIRTLPVAAMPVPASPSGGQRGMPTSRSPWGSNSRAPAGVSVPASCPAVSTWGKISSSFQGKPLPEMWASKARIMEASKPPVALSMGNMPEASPTPNTLRPVSR